MAKVHLQEDSQHLNSLHMKTHHTNNVLIVQENSMSMQQRDTFPFVLKKQKKTKLKWESQVIILLNNPIVRLFKDRIQ